MTPETHSANSSMSTDYQTVMAQMATLREDMAKLVHSTANAASVQGHTMARDVSDGMSEAMRFIGRKTHDADVSMERAISANPYIALGIAAGMGVLLGALTRR